LPRFEQGARFVSMFAAGHLSVPTSVIAVGASNHRGAIFISVPTWVIAVGRWSNLRAAIFMRTHVGARRQMFSSRRLVDVRDSDTSWLRAKKMQCADLVCVTLRLTR
jgi:hypothetical protein